MPSPNPDPYDINLYKWNCACEVDEEGNTMPLTYALASTMRELQADHEQVDGVYAGRQYGHETADDIAHRMLLADVMKMRLQSHSYYNIASALNISREHASSLVREGMREILKENGAEEMRAMEVQRLERITQRLWPLLEDPNDPTTPPNLRALREYMGISKLKAELVGAAVDKKSIIKIEQDDDDKAHAKVIASNLERLMDLADRVAASGVGSGRAMTTGDGDDENVVDAELVDDLSSATSTARLHELEPVITSAPEHFHSGRWVNGVWIDDEETPPDARL